MTIRVGLCGFVGHSGEHFGERELQIREEPRGHGVRLPEGLCRDVSILAPCENLDRLGIRRF